jgi:hypothetical protein
MDTRPPCPCTPCGHTSQHPDAASHAFFGYRSNELLKAFERLRVLYYEDTIAATDWEWSGHEAPIVRFFAVREQAASEVR